MCNKGDAGNNYLAPTTTRYEELQEGVSPISERPVSSVGRAWDSYIANQQCSSNPRVVGSSPTSGAAFLHSGSMEQLFPIVRPICEHNNYTIGNPVVVL